MFFFSRSSVEPGMYGMVGGSGKLPETATGGPIGASQMKAEYMNGGPSGASPMKAEYMNGRPSGASPMKAEYMSGGPSCAGPLDAEQNRAPAPNTIRSPVKLVISCKQCRVSVFFLLIPPPVRVLLKKKHRS